MKKSFIIWTLFFFVSTSFSQVVSKDSINKLEQIEKINDENDILNDTIFIEEVQINKDKLDPEAKKQFLLLQNRVYRVYPFAKSAGEKLVMLQKNMDKLKSEKEKRRYFKIAEDYLENEFKAKLKKLSRKQGQILIKLIHRQTGISSYNLIKEYKSGWKAFWSNNTAKIFDLNLKDEFKPYDRNEDFLIEVILYRAFSNGRLVEQKAANPVDIDELQLHWEDLSKELKKKNP
jgi:hypothetical protein